MIRTTIGPAAPWYRAIAPRWSYAPESGAGAAVGGGRFNRPGVEARYLADRPEGALREYRGESVLLPPATVATFLVTAAPIVDFRGGYDSKLWGPEWANAYCDWQFLWLTAHTEPPSWTLGDLVIEAGAAGLLYTSRHGASDCLVLYPAMTDATGFLAPVHDPSGALPKNSAGWRSGDP
jgi:RES domain-containing protein